MAPFLNLIGFFAAMGVFAKVFLRSVVLGWGWTVLVNVPNLFLIYKLLNPKHGNDLASLLVFITVFGGFGGIGIGALVGMVIASVRAHGEAA